MERINPSSNKQMARLANGTQGEVDQPKSSMGEFFAQLLHSALGSASFSDKSLAKPSVMDDMLAHLDKKPILKAEKETVKDSRREDEQLGLQAEREETPQFVDSQNDSQPEVEPECRNDCGVVSQKKESEDSVGQTKVNGAESPVVSTKEQSDVGQASGESAKTEVLPTTVLEAPVVEVVEEKTTQVPIGNIESLHVIPVATEETNQASEAPAEATVALTIGEGKKDFKKPTNDKSKVGSLELSSLLQQEQVVEDGASSDPRLATISANQKNTLETVANEALRKAQSAVVTPKSQEDHLREQDKETQSFADYLLHSELKEPGNQLVKTVQEKSKLTGNGGEALQLLLRESGMNSASFQSSSQTQVRDNLLQVAGVRDIGAKEGLQSEKVSAKQFLGSRGSEMLERIQQVLVTSAANRDVNTVVIRLDPPSLGEVTLKVSQRGDDLHARIVPESKEVENMLRSKSGEIAQALASIGIKLENVHVSIGSAFSLNDSATFAGLSSGFDHGGNSKGNDNGRLSEDNPGESSGDVWSEGNRRGDTELLDSGWLA